MTDPEEMRSMLIEITRGNDWLECLFKSSKFIKCYTLNVMPRINGVAKLNAIAGCYNGAML